MDSADSTSYPQVRAFFVGGAGDEITGSSTLIKITKADGTSEYGMVDAGGVQGKSEHLKYEYPVIGEKISFIILTHAHFDHIGMLPLLYKRGFRGKIYCTNIVRSIAHPLLLDAARLNELDIRLSGRNKKILAKTEQRLIIERALSTNPKDIKSYDNGIEQLENIEDEAIYGQMDVENVMNLFEPIDLFVRVKISENVYVRLLPTTHQDGAARVELYIGSGKNRCNIAFTGDIGPNNPVLYRYGDYYYNESINYLVLESLHGVDEPQETLKTSINRLMEIIKKGIRQHKHIILAGFSLDRNAMLVYLMSEFKKQNIKIDVFVDSPLTFTMLSIYDSFYKTDKYYFKDLGQNPFNNKNIKVILRGIEHKESVLHGEAPRVIITASANGNGGRIIGYFEKGIQSPNYVFVFCGWIDPNSPSSQLHECKIGEICEVGKNKYVKHCKTYRLHGLSAHGYYPDMVKIVEDYPNLNGLVLNHAEMNVKLQLREQLSSVFEGKIYIPELSDAYVFEQDGIRKMNEDEALLEFDSDIIIRTAVNEEDTEE